MLNAILHHVGMPWIISSNNEILYEIRKNNYPDWFNKVHWYSTANCSKLRGELFEYFIKNARKDRYYLMCSIISHDKQQPTYFDDEISGRGRPIPKNAITEALESLVDTLKQIDCWLELFHRYY